MPYVTGGYASARFTHEVFVGVALDNTMSTRNQGCYIGGGVDWIVSPGWIAGIEYRYTDLGSETFTVSPPPALNASPYPASADYTTHTVTFRLNYKF